MIQDSTPATDPGRPGNPADKRAHRRHAVNLDALITGGGLESRACKIRDFCAVGMFLALDPSAAEVAQRPIAAGEEFSIHFFLHRASHELHARVARVLPSGIGVALHDPNATTIAALMEAAKVSAEADARSRIAVPAAAFPREAALKTCRDLFERYVGQFLTGFFRCAEDGLFQASREAFSNVDQRRFWDAKTLVKTRRAEVDRRVLEALLEQFDHAGAPRLATGMPKPAPGSMELSLINTGEFEEFLAITETVDKAESYYRGRLREIERRLSMLWSMKIDKVNNPLGPGAVTRAFCDACQPLGADLDVQRVLYQAYVDGVVPELGRLYEDLNNELKNAGVPLLEEPVVPRRPASPVVPSPAADAGAAPAPRPAEAASRVEAGQVADIREEEPSVGVAAAAAPAVVRPVGTVQAAHTLFNLRRQLRTPAPPIAPPAAPLMGEATLPPAAAVPPAMAQGVAPSPHLVTSAPMAGATAIAQPAPAADRTVAYYNPEELAAALAAMAAMEMTAAEPTGGIDVRALRPQLESALTRERPDEAARRISDQDWDVLELIVELFNAVLNDARILDDVKPFIRRLRRPVNQLALAQPSFFEAADHPARRVLNKLAEIGSLTGSDPTNPIGPRLEGIVGRIAEQAARRPEVFAEAADEIERIAAEQTRAYADNVAHLAQAAEEQQQFLKARRKATGGEARPAMPAMSEEWAEWLSRVRRLKVGDALEMTVGKQKKKVSVAWVGEDHSSLILADTLGNKTGSVGLQELAMQMRRGTARVLEQTGMPAVDRALYTSLQNAHGRLAEEAVADPLTGLVKENAFREAMEDAMVEARRDCVSHALGVLAVDRLDEVRDRGGEAAGNDLLRQVAARLREAVAAEVLSARLGGELLAVLLRDVTQGQGFERVDRARDALAAAPYRIGEAEMSITASAGLAPFGADAPSVERVIEAARSAAQIAHRAGGNTTRIHHVEEVEDVSVRSRELLGEHLAGALQAGSLQLAAQRIVPQRQDPGLPAHLELMPSLAMEAGLRAEQAALRRAAEQKKRGADLDRWLIRAAMRWVADHPDRLPADGLCLLRLSGDSIADDGTVAFITDELLNTAIPPSRLCFELSDTSGLGGRSGADELVQALREFGCRFAVGDFGSGQSSLARIKDLKIDIVRIARMAGRDIVNDRADATLVCSVVEMARFLGVPAVADCADSSAMLTKLRDLGVDYAQGNAVAAVETLA